MAELTVIYWRDIPAQVVAKAGRASAKQALSPRFQDAIDRAAMRAGAHGTDAYLAEWRRGAPVPCAETLDSVVAAAATGLEAAYDEARLADLVAAGGRALATSERPDPT
jgi:hypothetical protein